VFGGDRNAGVFNTAPSKETVPLVPNCEALAMVVVAHASPMECLGLIDQIDLLRPQEFGISADAVLSYCWIESRLPTCK
jgi:hypothetical protein